MKLIKINTDNTIENININFNNSDIKKKLVKNTTNKGSGSIIELYNWNNKKIRAPNYGALTQTNSLKLI